MSLHTVKHRVKTHSKFRRNAEDIQRRFQKHSLHHIPFFVVITICAFCRIGSEVKSVIRFPLPLKISCFHFLNSRKNSVVHITFLINNLKIITLLQAEKVDGIIKNLSHLVGSIRTDTRRKGINCKIAVDISCQCLFHNRYFALRFVSVNRVSKTYHYVICNVRLIDKTMGFRGVFFIVQKSVNLTRTYILRVKLSFGFLGDIMNIHRSYIILF